MLEGSTNSSVFVKRGLTRRQFLSATAVAAGSTMFMGLTSSATAAPTNLTATPDVEATITHQACPRNCHDTCSILTNVVDGQIVDFDGDPSNPITAGGLCVKMNHYMSWVYHPDRILYPMKRVGAKGEGKFERITWDEALATIADKLKTAIAAHGPETVLPYSYSGNLGLVNNYGAPHRFFYKLGASKLARNICSSAGSATIPYTYGYDRGIDPEQYAETKLYISWGINEAATNVHAIKFFKQMKEKGGKVVVVNPVRTPVANFADIFIRVKPGTDAALALGVANILINEGLVDNDFIQQHTIGYDELVQQASKYPVDLVSEITGVPQEQIFEFARLYGSIKPSILRIGYGIQRNSNGGSIVRAISLLPPLVGTLGAGHNSGYAYINSGYWSVDWAGMDGRNQPEGKDARIINMNELGKALTGELETTQKTPITAMITWNSNPVAVGSNVAKIRKGLAREDLFMIVADIFATDTADYADILLPACTFFEYEDVNIDYLGWYIRYNQPAIAPLGESKANIDIFNSLAKAMGFTDELFNDTSADVIRTVIGKGEGYLKGISYEALQKNKWMKLNVPVPFGDKKFPTPSGKVEFYSERLIEAGMHPVAEYVPTAESLDGNPELYKKYPFTVLSPATKNLLNSQMHNIPQIEDLIGKPIVFVNTVDATARGIQDGDIIELYNDRGATKIHAKLSDEATAPGVLLTLACPWPKLLISNTSINELTSDRLTDLGGCSTYHTNLVDIRKV